MTPRRQAAPEPTPAPSVPPTPLPPPPPTESPELARARRSLARRDPILRRVIKDVGPCTLVSSPDVFGVLVRMIIAQQISTAAARSVHRKLVAAAGEGGVEPARVLGLTDDMLRGCGLSAGKIRAVRDLAERLSNGGLPVHDLSECDDATVSERFCAVRGIGPWTVQMLLIFGLGRRDVLPVGDFGLRAAVRRHYELAELPTKAELIGLAEKWQPYRSIATWYLWKSSGFVPQSGPEPD